MSQPDRAPLVYRALVGVVRVLLKVLVRRRWTGLERVPRTGPALVVSNHTSNFDAISLGDALVAAGRWPRFLGKADIWKVPGLGWLARQCRQIPVERHTERAKDALVHATTALAEGDCVVIFPEGTITRDPEGWPMVARRGAARLALTTGAPVIPIAQEGPAAILGGRHLELRKLFSLRRRPIDLLVGEPLDLDEFRPADGAEPGEEQVEAASWRITEALTALYGQLRREPVPELIWNPWSKDYVTRGV